MDIKQEVSRDAFPEVSYKGSEDVILEASETRQTIGGHKMDESIKISLELLLPVLTALLVVLIQESRLIKRMRRDEEKREQSRMTSLSIELRSLKSTQELILSALNRIEERQDILGERVASVEAKTS